MRTQGYLPGPTDVYVSLGQVKKYNLRKGDAVIGAIRQPREGDNQGRQKYNALVSVDTVNGQSVEEAAHRVDFQALTAVYPTERVRLETTKDELAGRMADVFTPVGKGQRGVIVGPAGSGKSHMVAAMAAAVAQNAPDAHLMVVLVDEQPEAITEMQRAQRVRSLPPPSIAPPMTTPPLRSSRLSARSVWWSSVTMLWCSWTP